MPLINSLVMMHRMFAFAAIVGLILFPLKTTNQQELNITQVTEYDYLQSKSSACDSPKENNNMIKMTIQDLHLGSPECPSNCGNYKIDGCVGVCTSRFRTTFICPNCNSVHCFYGASNPKICGSCTKTLPDMFLMRSDKSHYTRITYHLEEA